MLTRGIGSVQTQNKLIPIHCSISTLSLQCLLHSTYGATQEETSIRRRIKQRNSRFDMLISFTSHLGSWVWWSRKGTEAGQLIKEKCWDTSSRLVQVLNSSSAIKIDECLYCCLGRNICLTAILAHSFDNLRYYCKGCSFCHRTERHCRSIHESTTVMHWCFIQIPDRLFKLRRHWEFDASNQGQPKLSDQVQTCLELCYSNRFWSTSIHTDAFLL